MDFDDFPTDILGYHRRTKHAPHRYALGPAFLDWDSQPDGFRRFDGARLIALPLCLQAPTPPFAQLDHAAPQDLSPQSLGLFLELALGLSAWKEIEGSRWPLRNNPSSGNLHPTEGWAVLPALDGISDAPGLYHYAPREHGLEERRRLDQMPMALPQNGFLLALSSVVWREAWKYGERAFRYCQHDVGHAIAAASYAAACLGWRLRILTGPGDDALTDLLGLRRDDCAHPYESEHPDLIALVSPAPAAEAELSAVAGEWFGQANRLSVDHESWPAIDRALRFSRRGEGEGDKGAAGPAQGGAAGPALIASACVEPCADVIRRRRSAQRMNKGSGISRDAFLRILAGAMPAPDRAPWSAFPWAARLALVVMVHQVEGLEPGLYALIRDPDSLARLRGRMKPSFAWIAVPDCPLPLYVLETRPLRAEAAGLSCLQAIAGHSAFSLAMLADFARTLGEDGAWSYRRLHWEAGMIGQVLYLESVAAGVSGTGIGCFFDDQVHAMLGLDVAAQDWQTLYHFTIGEAVEDSRISTLPAYAES